MDIYIRDVPSAATKKELHRFFAEPLAQYRITYYHCELLRERFRGKPFAIITVLDAEAGRQFLRYYGMRKDATSDKRAQKPLFWYGTLLRCTESKYPPNEFNLKALEYEASLPAKATPVPSTRQLDYSNDYSKDMTRFAITGLQCGTWENIGSDPTFTCYSEISQPGTISLGPKELIVLLGSPESDQKRVDISYWSCEQIILYNHQRSTIIATLRYAPRFYQVNSQDDLATRLSLLTLGKTPGRHNQMKKTRLLGLDDAHKRIAGVCMVYGIRVSNSKDLIEVGSLLRRNGKIPATITMQTKFYYPTETLSHGLTHLAHELSDMNKSGGLPFRIRYQLERLARNAALPPQTVIQLLQKTHRLHQQLGSDPTSYALARLYRHLPLAGTGMDPSDFGVRSLEKKLEELANLYDFTSNNAHELGKRHDHKTLVHKVVVTPTGLYLDGIGPEPTNRVLRRYAEYTDHFIRVIFTDEDGGRVNYDPRASQEQVFQGRFKKVLDDSIVIAGRRFSFLGFSHSSLRSQKCWFMAPIMLDGTMALAPQILKELGDFTHIRTPAKCAARVGQNFTDTNSTVEIHPDQVGEIPVITRNDRDFSDGVGTISEDLLARVWEVYGTKRLLKPSVLQIRFQGAKGMVALDTCLHGERLMLRSNMKKFETASSWNLEICGAAFRPLPLTLNRQFIKIFEDLGIDRQVFIDLQTKAIDRLRYLTASTAKTATFLKEL